MNSKEDISHQLRARGAYIINLLGLEPKHIIKDNLYKAYEFTRK